MWLISHFGGTNRCPAIHFSVAAVNSFQQPWAAGPRKDYSDNQNYNVGEFIQMSWTVAVSNAPMALTQDNFPGDGRGGPSVTVQSMYSSISLNLIPSSRC